MPPEEVITPTTSVVQARRDDGLSPLLGDPEAIKNFLEQTRQVQSDRRKKKTPKSRIKRRKGGKDENGNEVFFSYVDRPDYQIWLDENFPGWTEEDRAQFWETRITNADGQQATILFHSSVFLKVIEATGIQRRVTGVGSCSVSAKEMDRANASLLQKKYGIAKTNAMKEACNWLGAFFDLRADEEERDEAAKGPIEIQMKRYAGLISRLVHLNVPEEGLTATDKAWATQTFRSADKFLDGLEKKVKDFEITQAAKKETTANAGS